MLIKKGEMKEMSDNEYWAIVDENGELYMKNLDIGAEPLYIGKHKGLAEAIQKMEAILKSSAGEAALPKIAKVRVDMVVR